MDTCFKITDDRFSTERTDLYDLVFEIQFSRLRFLVRSGDQLLWLEDHFLGNTNDISAFMSQCTGVLNQHPFLQIPFWKSVRLVTNFQIHTLLPSSVFTSSKAEKYLTLAYPSVRFSDFEINYEEVSSQYVITGTVAKINRLFRERYPDVKVISAIAVGLQYFSTLSPDQSLAIVSDSFIDLYYQNGKSKTLVAEKLPVKNLDHIQAFTPVLVLSGEVTPFSGPYGILKEKFHTVIISGTTPAGVPAEKFRDFPEHRYFTLLNTGTQRA